MTEMEVRKILAQNLKKLRKQFGLSQQKLANEVQMAMTFINDIENCKKWVSPETLAKFSVFFNVPVGALFCRGNFFGGKPIQTAKRKFHKNHNGRTASHNRQNCGKIFSIKIMKPSALLDKNINYINVIESGKSIPPIAMIERIAKILRVEPKCFLEPSEKTEKEYFDQETFIKHAKTEIANSTETILRKLLEK